MSISVASGFQGLGPLEFEIHRDPLEQTLELFSLMSTADFVPAEKNASSTKARESQRLPPPVALNELQPQSQPSPKPALDAIRSTLLDPIKVEPNRVEQTEEDIDDDDKPLHLLLQGSHSQLNQLRSQPTQAMTNGAQGGSGANKWSISRKLRRMLSLKGRKQTLEQGEKMDQGSPKLIALQSSQNSLRSQTSSKRDLSSLESGHEERDGEHWSSYPRSPVRRMRPPHPPRERLRMRVNSAPEFQYRRTEPNVHRSARADARELRHPRRRPLSHYYHEFQQDPIQRLQHPGTGSTARSFYSLPSSPCPSADSNSSISSTASLASSTDTSLSSPQKSPVSSGRRLKFSDDVQVQFTHHPDQYDRTSDPHATCTRLSAGIALQIKRELNEYKMREMVVHEASRIYTHFFS
ncbi:uncharacterized protein VTP21DRAFT_2812 [Calcarisporiella thermophila]|uniref:uncharacterized protein n=1 Tax=Calcarisporiella thermophila TaxID=911321 RepID=UPI00374234B2